MPNSLVLKERTHLETFVHDFNFVERAWCSLGGSTKLRLESRAEAEKALYHLFKECSSELYWLAFLFTGDRQRSVHAFISALDLEDGATPVFLEFMVSWARKLVIGAALATIHSELRESALRTARSPEKDFTKLDSLATA